MKFGQLLDRWLEQIEGDRSPTTMREQPAADREDHPPGPGSTSVRRSNPHKLDALYEALLRSRAVPASVRQVHAVIRSACRQGVKWGWMSSNPATDTCAPEASRPAGGRAGTPDEVRAMIKAAEADDPDMATLIAVAAVHGARRGELSVSSGGTWTGSCQSDHRTLGDGRGTQGDHRLRDKDRRHSSALAVMTSASKSCGVTCRGL